MNPDSPRSEQVVEDYKRHKLAHSALHRVHAILQGFERDRLVDARLARIGIALMVLLMGVALYFLFSAETITLS